MYVPDWGGCSPYGDLFFTNNVLGNVEKRSPNFRCAPQDPEPWNPNFELPTNTLYHENEFDPPPYLEEAASKRSKHRHEELSLRASNAIEGFSSFTNEISFTLSSDAEIEITTASPSADLSIFSASNGALLHSLRDQQTILKLPKGSYSIVRPNPSTAGAPPRYAVAVASRTAAIIAVSAASDRIEINTGAAIKQHYLVYATGPPPKELILKAEDLSVISRSESWIDHPFHWQTLRAFIDINAQLPTTETRAILSELPQGTFIVEATKGTEQTTLTISLQPTAAL
jgi:hypothetical protein